MPLSEPVVLSIFGHPDMLGGRGRPMAASREASAKGGQPERSNNMGE
jgi:hypothetical protein